MIISFHIGAHCTQSSKLSRGLWKNKALLEEHDVIIASGARYRDMLPDVMRKIGTNQASPETEEMILDNILDQDDCGRLILGYENIISHPQYVFQGNKLYGNADYKLQWLRNVFPSYEMEFTLGIRNPATFIPHLCPSPSSYPDLIRQTNLDTMKWSDVVGAIRTSCPDVGLNVFAHEDTPLTWPHIIRTIAGVGPTVQMEDDLAIIANIITRDGLKRLRTYLHTHTPQTEAQRQVILSSFLNQYIDETTLETEIDLPGWDDQTVEQLTETYEDDLFTIEDMDGVNMILPI